MTRIDSERRLCEELVRSHAGDVYRFAYRLCGDRELADDLVQETFCEAWRSIASLRDRTAGRPWLLQILRHRHAHAVRARGRRAQAIPEVDELTPVASESNVLVQLSDQEVLQRALGSISDTYRQPFLLVFLSGFTCREAADVLDVPLGTVLSRIHRARQQLRSAVRNLDPAGTPVGEPRRAEK